MAIKTLQNLAVRTALKSDVRVTGTDCNGAMPAMMPRRLSLLWQVLPSPVQTDADSEDNSEAANAVLRAGRSAAFAGVSRTPLHASYQAKCMRVG